MIADSKYDNTVRLQLEKDGHARCAKYTKL